ncbi:MAG: hypothetical protein QXO75_10155 [Nitrososphaerota archaeon]
MNGNRKYVFAIVDDTTCFYLAQEVSGTKFLHDARTLFRNSKNRTGKKPVIVITDVLPSNYEAFNEKYYSSKRDSVHINIITLAGEHNNNLMERTNG